MGKKNAEPLSPLHFESIGLRRQNKNLHGKAHVFFSAAIMISSTRVLPSARTTALCAPAVAKRTIHPQRARQRPFSAATSSPNPFSSSSWSLSANQCQPRPSVSVAAASPSAASSSGAPDGESNDNDWLSQGLLRIVYPAQALLLLLGAASMVALPSGFCELALQSCPLPPPRTAVQLAGAALALPSAASLALAHAASVPGRLSSSTYVALNAGLSLFGLAVAAAASTAVAPSSLPPLAAGAVASFLAPAKFYSYLLLIGPLALAVSCSTAATVSWLFFLFLFSFLGSRGQTMSLKKIENQSPTGLRRARSRSRSRSGAGPRRRRRRRAEGNKLFSFLSLLAPLWRLFRRPCRARAFWCCCLRSQRRDLGSFPENCGIGGALRLRGGRGALGCCFEGPVGRFHLRQAKAGGRGGLRCRGRCCRRRRGGLFRCPLLRALARSGSFCGAAAVWRDVGVGAGDGEEVKGRKCKRNFSRNEQEKKLGFVF